MSENGSGKSKREAIIISLIVVLIVGGLCTLFVARSRVLKRDVAFTHNPLEDGVSVESFVAELAGLYPEIVVPDAVGLIRLTGTVENGRLKIESIRVYCYRDIERPMISYVCYSGVLCDMSSMKTEYSWLSRSLRYNKDFTDADYMHGYTVKLGGAPMLHDIIVGWENSLSEKERDEYERAKVVIELHGTDEYYSYWGSFKGRIEVSPDWSYPGLEPEWRFGEDGQVFMS